MGKTKQKYREGNIFAVPLPIGGYLFGKILLNVERIRKMHILAPESPLLSSGNPVLVEMYSPVSSTLDCDSSELLIPGVFLQTDAFGESWPILDTIPVDIQRIEFPETLIGFIHDGGGAAFRKGELHIPLAMSREKFFSIYVLSTAHSSYYWPTTCLKLLGQGDEIPEEYKDAPLLSQYDLRFSPHREYVYSMLPFDMSQSYYEQQAQMRFDIGRLYP